MRLIVIQDAKDATGAGVLRYALSTAPLANVLIGAGGTFFCSVGCVGGFLKVAGGTEPGDLAWVVPNSWQGHPIVGTQQTVTYAGRDGVRLQGLKDARNYPWLVVSNGRYATHISDELLERTLAETDADAVAVTANARLLAYREYVRLTQQGQLVGYRRLFRESVEPAPMPIAWPHHLLVRAECVETVLGEGLPPDFGALIERFQSCRLKVQAVVIAGSVADLESAEGLLAFSRAVLTRTSPWGAMSRVEYGRQTLLWGQRGQVSSRARFVGPVLLGDHVCVESDAVIIGPSILCDNCTVRQGAVVDSSILGAEVVVDQGQILRDTLNISPKAGPATARPVPRHTGQAAGELVCSPRQSPFRTWSRFSYARCWKRIADVVAATIVLVLFAPVIPFIALAIKVNSKGPVFFKDKRQGLHGRLFNCIKFRTMRVGAADIQDKLRFVSEVDGPQFKMADDPRISTVGHFLRETYLDEIPQFFNVLLGQMSIVGPRPSPESENTLCPWWRDARLSVRPGITGLWQVYRTREVFKDFQEWIHYDTKYVQELSPRLDLWICWRTFKKMVNNFIRQF